MGSLANYRSRRQVRLLCIFPNCLLSKHGVLLVFLSFLILILIRGISNKNLELQVHFLKLTQRRSLYFHWVTDVFPTEFPCLQLCSLHSFIHSAFIQTLLCSRHWELKVNKLFFFFFLGEWSVMMYLALSRLSADACYPFLPLMSINLPHDSLTMWMCPEEMGSVMYSEHPQHRLFFTALSTDL